MESTRSAQLGDRAGRASNPPTAPSYRVPQVPRRDLDGGDGPSFAVADDVTGGGVQMAVVAAGGNNIADRDDTVGDRGDRGGVGGRIFGIEDTPRDQKGRRASNPSSKQT